MAVNPAPRDQDDRGTYDTAASLPADAAVDLARALFDQSPFSSVIYRPDGTVLALNAAFTSLMGLTLDDVPPEYTVLTDAQLDAQGVLPLVERAFAGEMVTFPPIRYDGTMFGRTGQVTWTQGHMYPVRDPSGALTHVVLVHVDLTARIEAETALTDSRAALAAAQERLAAILDAVSDGITVQDPEGKLVYANNAAARLNGFGSAEAFLSAPLNEVLERFELFAPDGSPIAHDQLPAGRAARGETDPEQLLRYRNRKTGEERWSYVRARAIPARAGRPVLYVNYFQDITERRRREQELEDTTAQLQQLTAEQESTLEQLTIRSEESEHARRAAEWAEEQWRFLAEASRILGDSLDVEQTLRSVTQLAVPRIADWCAVHLLDADGSIRQLEVAHADPRRVQEARELQQLYPPAPDSGVQRVVKTGRSELYGSISEDLLMAAARDAEHLGRLRRLGLHSAMIVPLVTESVAVGAITLISAESGRSFDARDLTFAESLAARAASAIHAAELFREAQEANRAKAEFLAVMSHELRTPLNAIMGYADLLTGGISGPLNPRQQEQLSRISTSARHLTDLIETVLAFARIEAGREEVHPADVDLRELAEEAAAFVAPAAEKKGLALSMDLQRVVVRSDVAKIRQILLNLLSNAVKFTEYGFVAVVVRRQGSDAIVEVHDSGVGIEPELIDRIWEPFIQLDPTLTRRSGGTGLGLPVSAGLAELLGGSISVRSTPGEGSVFTLRLPLAP